jgi:hypothetical protein
MVQSNENNSLSERGLEKLIQTLEICGNYFHRFAFILGYRETQAPNSINISPPFKIEASFAAIKTVNVLMAALLTVAAEKLYESGNEGLNRNQNTRNNPSLMLSQNPENLATNQQLTFKLLNFITAKKYVFASGALSQLLIDMLLQNFDPMSKATLQAGVSMILEPALAYAAPKGATLCHAAFFNIKERIQEALGQRTNYTPISDPRPSGLGMD